jgi:hypothetical protein
MQLAPRHAVLPFYLHVRVQFGDACPSKAGPQLTIVVAPSRSMPRAS